MFEDPIYKGDLVMWRPTLNPLPWVKKHEDKIGIVIDRRPRWPNDTRDDEMIIIVLYPDSGEEAEWSDRDLQVVSSESSS